MAGANPSDLGGLTETAGSVSEMAAPLEPHARRDHRRTPGGGPCSPAAVVADRNSPQKQVWWARIIPPAIGGCGTSEIMRRIGKNKPCVWRWQARFMATGLAALLRDKTPPPPPKAGVEQAIELTRAPPPREVTHRTGRATANAVGISLSAVQGIWKAHGPVPCRVRTFKLCPRIWSSSA